MEDLSRHQQLRRAGAKELSTVECLTIEIGLHEVTSRSHLVSRRLCSGILARALRRPRVRVGGSRASAFLVQGVALHVTKQFASLLQSLGMAPKSAADDENEPITSWRSKSLILSTFGLCRRDTIVATPSRPSTTARLVGRCANTPPAFETSRRRQRLQRSPGPQTGCSTRQ